MTTSPNGPQSSADAPAVFVQPAVEDYTANTAELAQIEAEIAQLEAGDASMNDRLQLQSEVVGLRKELAVVQEDEERLRKQLANAELLVAAHDPKIGTEVGILEDEAARSTLQSVWAEECLIRNPEKMDWAEINITDLLPRLNEARSLFMQASSKADQLYAQQEARININTDDREAQKAAFMQTFNAEMENLAPAREQCRQIRSEQHYHYKRGTTRRDKPNVVPAEKKETSRQRRIDRAETRSSAFVDAMNSELVDLMEECKVLKKQLDNSRKISEEKKAEMERSLETVQEDGAEPREMREKLQKERDELTALKADLQGVLHYVRARNREDGI